MLVAGNWMCPPVEDRFHHFNFIVSSYGHPKTVIFMNISMRHVLPLDLMMVCGNGTNDILIIFALGIRSAVFSILQLSLWQIAYHSICIIIWNIKWNSLLCFIVLAPDAVAKTEYGQKYKKEQKHEGTSSSYPIFLLAPTSKTQPQTKSVFLTQSCFQISAKYLRRSLHLIYSTQLDHCSHHHPHHNCGSHYGDK